MKKAVIVLIGLLIILGLSFTIDDVAGQYSKKAELNLESEKNQAELLELWTASRLAYGQASEDKSIMEILLHGMEKTRFRQAMVSLDRTWLLIITNNLDLAEKNLKLNKQHLQYLRKL